MRENCGEEMENGSDIGPGSIDEVTNAHLCAEEENGNGEDVGSTLELGRAGAEDTRGMVGVEPAPPS